MVRMVKSAILSLWILSCRDDQESIQRLTSLSCEKVDIY